jgi:hypothetical protein
MNILIPKKGWTVWDVLKGMQDTGWKHGRSAKAYVAGDLVGAEKTILLCGGASMASIGRNTGTTTSHITNRSWPQACAMCARNIAPA